MPDLWVVRVSGQTLQLLSAVRDARGISATAKLVLLVLVAHVDAHAQSYPSLRRLAEETGLGRSTVIRALADLEAAGWVRRQRRKDGAGDPTSSIYTVVGSPAAGRGGVTTGLPQSQSGTTGSAIAGPGVVPERDPKEHTLKEPKSKELTEARAARADRLRGTRITKDWTPMPETVEAFAKSDRIDARQCVTEFVDFWVAVPGEKGLKLDWEATFRNSVRRLIHQGRAPALTGAPAHRPIPPPHVIDDEPKPLAPYPRPWRGHRADEPPPPSRVVLGDDAPTSFNEDDIFAALAGNEKARVA